MQDDTQIDDAGLLSWLADGVDPFSGEVFPKDHVLQQPQIIRALFHAIRALKSEPSTSTSTSKPKQTLPAAAGKAWNNEEDLQLVREFDSAMPIAQIAAIHQRTRGAISSRLVRLGKITRRDEVEQD